MYSSASSASHAARSPCTVKEEKGETVQEPQSLEGALSMHHALLVRCQKARLCKAAPPPPNSLRRTFLFAACCRETRNSRGVVEATRADLLLPANAAFQGLETLIFR